MKKLLAIVLSALMMVCAVVPAFADEPILLTPNTEIPEEFVEAGQLHAKDFQDQNDGLVYYDVAAGPGENGQYTFVVGYGSDDTLVVLPGVEYGMTFEVETAGTYHFCVAHYVRGDDAWTEGKEWWHGGQVRVDDGQVYEINEKDLTGLNKNALHYYTGITVELTEGEHTFYFIGTRPNGMTAHFSDVFYYLEGEEGMDPAGDAEDTDAPAADDTPAAPSTPAGAAITETLPAIFEDADYVNLYAIYEDVNAAAEGAYTAGEVLYCFNQTDFNKFGIPETAGVMPFPDCKYPVEFEATDDGLYTFGFSFAPYTKVGSILVEIVNSEGDVIATETVASGDVATQKMSYATLSTKLELAAGEYYTALVSGPTGDIIVCDFYYALADGSTGSTGSTTGGNTAPATFDASLIALAVAGVSAAAAAVVSKKRR